MTCPKCSSNNVNVQAVAIVKNKHKGALYWLLIGWWFELFMWLILTLPMLIIKIFKPKGVKTVVKNMAVCQTCGYSWKV